MTAAWTCGSKPRNKALLPSSRHHLAANWSACIGAPPQPCAPPPSTGAGCATGVIIGDLPFPAAAPLPCVQSLPSLAAARATELAKPQNFAQKFVVWSAGLNSCITRALTCSGNLFKTSFASCWPVKCQRFKKAISSGPRPSSVSQDASTLQGCWTRAWGGICQLWACASQLWACVSQLWAAWVCISQGEGCPSQLRSWPMGEAAGAAPRPVAPRPTPAATVAAKAFSFAPMLRVFPRGSNSVITVSRVFSGSDSKRFTELWSRPQCMMKAAMSWSLVVAAAAIVSSLGI
mmetsp:Transcript_33687/g.93024  ORF Transcript_33687/g.93024 Transcript_33687/m.93024 type:complete len:290 (-) Transcript_33687:525-1394(-)